MTPAPMRIATLAAFALTASACGNAGVPLIQTGVHHAASLSALRSAPAVYKDHALLYVAESDRGIAVYDLSAACAQQVEYITTGVSVPSSVTVDSRGNLYVSNAGTRNVTVYPFGATAPTLTLTPNAGTTWPGSVAVLPNGTVYLVTRGRPSAIDIFPAGQSTPSQVITNALITTPAQAVFDSSGNFYVADNATGVYEIPSGSNTPQSLHLVGLQSASGIALDESLHRLYVSNVPYPHYWLSVYSIGQTMPLYKLPVTAANNIAFGSGHYDYLFTPDLFTGAVNVYLPKGRTPIETLSFYSPQGIAYKPPRVP